MEVVQWIVAAATAVFVALVGFFQWRTAQDKAALDLFERRHEIFLIVRKAVGQMVSSSPGFDQAREMEFLEMMERAYFFLRWRRSGLSQKAVGRHFERSDRRH
ncbi:hypothetical protein ACVWXQ_008996 [Bradyrhizobium sp. S3.14.4]